MTATRRLAAILAADVAGYSRLIGVDAEGTLNRLTSIRAELIDPKITEHRGRIVKTTGDGLLVEFSSVVDALRCAAQWQLGIGVRNADIPPTSRIEFRMGINVGDIAVEDGDIFGDGVNVAARLESLADPGGICVSARVQEDVADKALGLCEADFGVLWTYDGERIHATALRGVPPTFAEFLTRTPHSVDPDLASHQKPAEGHRVTN
jgi:class 3 adenylate cyclase